MQALERDTEFTAFVTEHRPRLPRAARLLATGDEAFAEDLVQTTLTRPSGEEIEYDGRTYWVLDSGAEHTPGSSR